MKGSIYAILSETEAQNLPHNTALSKAILNKLTLSPLSTGSGTWQPPSAVEESVAPTVHTVPVSYTSSRRELRRGAAPTGTPQDNAFYRVAMRSSSRLTSRSAVGQAICLAKPGGSTRRYRVRKCMCKVRWVPMADDSSR
jgi:hypothetical protein